MNNEKPMNESPVNYGIQASSVSAKAMAVGPNATAINKESGREDQQELQRAVEQLRNALSSLDLGTHAKATLNEDTAALTKAVTSDQVEPDKVGSLLKGLSDKLKMVGVVASEVVALSQPILKLAALLKIPLHVLGF